MYIIDFNKPIHVHFIGIGGISMSGLARILLHRHFTISGSDANRSDLTAQLEQEGCTITYEQTAKNITSDIDLIVYTAAMKNTNPEMTAALESRIPMLTRAQLLGEIMANYPVAINVAGTHGKTTTTSMLSCILMTACKDPTVSVGGILDSIGGNVRIGSSGYFITEACEYTNSFLSFKPTLNIILNVCEDHLDFFKDITDIRNSFQKFTQLLPDDGTLVINSDIDDYGFFYQNSKCRVITVGSDPSKSNYAATDITYDALGCPTYTLLADGKPVHTITLHVQGLHNVYNSLAAIAAAVSLGITVEECAQGLTEFGGTKRRFEYKGKFNGVTVIDDYAHHPDEIRATLNSAFHYPHNKIWCVFQPHTYSRTKLLFKEFGEALSLADAVVLADIYAARETNTLGISSADLAEEVKKHNRECYYFPSFEEIEKFLLKNCFNGDLLITMGAGNVYKIGEDIIE